MHTSRIARALRDRAAELSNSGVYDVSDLIAGANELDRLAALGYGGDDCQPLLAAIAAFHDDFKQYAVQRLKDTQGLTTVRDGISQLKESMKMLQPEVQALVDQVAKNTSFEASNDAAMKVIQGQNAVLAAQIAAIVPGVAVDAEDLATIVAQTQLMADSITALTPAVVASVPPDTVPVVPVDPAVVAAAAAATVTP
jgi:hypothetical protein